MLPGGRYGRWPAPRPPLSASSALGAEPVRGDLRDRASLEAAFAGCEVVYHVAGVNAFCLPDPRPMFEVNVAGSRAVVLAAAAAGVDPARLHLVGGDPGRRLVGAWPASPPRFLSNYARSKYEAEQAVLELSAEHGTRRSSA